MTRINRFEEATRQTKRCLAISFLEMDHYFNWLDGKNGNDHANSSLKNNDDIYNIIISWIICGNLFEMAQYAVPRRFCIYFVFVKLSTINCWAYFLAIVESSLNSFNQRVSHFIGSLCCLGFHFRVLYVK